MNTINKRSDCPLSCSLEILGDKWALLIIRDLMFTKKRTYSEFMQSSERIATNILASRLQILEENKIIEKLDHPDSKAKKMYNLTQKGIDLLSVVVEFHLWGEKYFRISTEMKAIIKEVKKDKEGFIKITTKELKKQHLNNSSS